MREGRGRGACQQEAGVVWMDGCGAVGGACVVGHAAGLWLRVCCARTGTCWCRCTAVLPEQAAAAGARQHAGAQASSGCAVLHLCLMGRNQPG